MDWINKFVEDVQRPIPDPGPSPTLPPPFPRVPQGSSANSASKQEERAARLVRHHPIRPRIRGFTRVFPALQSPPDDQEELSPEERQLAAMEDVREAFRLARQTDAELHPYRVRVAHRIVREILRVVGICAQDERLTETMVPNADLMDPWHDPLPYHGTDGSPYTVPIGQVFEEALLHGGISVLPPRPDPDHPKQPLLYVALIEATQRSLGIEAGTRNNPDLGRYGLKGLVDHRSVFHLFPNPYELLAWEEILVQETLDRLTSRGQRETLLWLRNEHGFTPNEQAGLLKQAKALARELVENDVEDDKAFMLLRLEDYVRRCRENVNLRQEIVGLKAIAQIMGLGKIEPEDQNTEFLKIVRKLDASKSLPAKPALNPKILPG